MPISESQNNGSPIHPALPPVLELNDVNRQKIFSDHLPQFYETASGNVLSWNVHGMRVSGVVEGGQFPENENQTRERAERIANVLLQSTQGGNPPDVILLQELGQGLESHGNAHTPQVFMQALREKLDAEKWEIILSADGFISCYSKVRYGFKQEKNITENTAPSEGEQKSAVHELVLWDKREATEAEVHFFNVYGTYNPNPNYMVSISKKVMATTADGKKAYFIGDLNTKTMANASEGEMNITTNPVALMFANHWENGTESVNATFYWSLEKPNEEEMENDTVYLYKEEGDGDNQYQVAIKGKGTQQYTIPRIKSSLEGLNCQQGEIKEIIAKSAINEIKDKVKLTKDKQLADMADAGYYKDETGNISILGHRALDPNTGILIDPKKLPLVPESHLITVPVVVPEMFSDKEVIAGLSIQKYNQQLKDVLENKDDEVYLCGIGNANNVQSFGLVYNNREGNIGQQLSQSIPAEDKDFIKTNSKNIVEPQGFISFPMEKAWKLNIYVAVALLKAEENAPDVNDLLSKLLEARELLQSKIDSLSSRSSWVYRVGETTQKKQAFEELVEKMDKAIFESAIEGSQPIEEINEIMKEVNTYAMSLSSTRFAKKMTHSFEMFKKVRQTLNPGEDNKREEILHVLNQQIARLSTAAGLDKQSLVTAEADVFSQIEQLNQKIERGNRDAGFDDQSLARAKVDWLMELRDAILEQPLNSPLQDLVGIVNDWWNRTIAKPGTDGKVKYTISELMKTRQNTLSLFAKSYKQLTKLKDILTQELEKQQHISRVI